MPDGVALNIANNVPDARLIFDAGFAQDALLNLVINAGEACGSNGEITVSADRTTDGQLLLRVRDNGPGFEKDALEMAVNPFYSSKGGKVGRGLGMTSAYDFAKSSGGILKYRNHPEGGAEVSIRIPYTVPAPLEGGMILLVDDDADVRQTVRTYLRRDGHDVIEAESLGEAAQLMTVDGLRLVVTDLDIGGRDTGLDVAEAAPQGLPVLIITGLPSGDPLRVRAEQAHPVLAKPFDYDALKQQLDKIAS